jgi:short-subunit dehydrogenase
MGGLDLVIYASGVMPLIEPNEFSFEKDEMTVDVNCLGAVAWLNEAAQRFEHTGRGSIVGISSVAADRGRRGFPVYGASKAFFDTYLEALRNRVARSGVVVTTIKPGPVDTPMSRGVKKRPLLISAEAAATATLNAVAKRKGVVYVPGTWRPIMFVVRHIPSFIFRKLNF